MNIAELNLASIGITTTDLCYIGRIILSSLCGGAIGYERQRRQKLAGIRTHVIVALASALMMVISKYGFYDVASDTFKVDPSRIAAGLVTAIGFLGSGVIYPRNKAVSGLTTSAGIWATVGVGMAMGSGMYLIGLASTVLILFVETYGGRELHPRSPIVIKKQIHLELDGEKKDIKAIRKNMEQLGFPVSEFTYRRGEGKIMKLSLTVKSAEDHDYMKLVELLEKDPQINEIRI